jgi:hypothetical protein
MGEQFGRCNICGKMKNTPFSYGHDGGTFYLCADCNPKYEERRVLMVARIGFSVGAFFLFAMLIYRKVFGCPTC